MEMTQKRKTRHKILAAANRVMLKDGPSNFTFEAVVKEAELSKGGVLYHFPSKEALVKGMLAAFLENLDRDLMDRSKGDDGAGSLTRAYVMSAFEPEAYLLEVSAGMLAAMTTNPELLEPAQRWGKDFQTRLEQGGLEPTLTTLVRLATDGLWYNEMFGLTSLSEEAKSALQQKLMALTRVPS